MSNTNYNKQNDFYKKNDHFIENIDVSISTLDLIIDKFNDNQPLKLWRQKSMVKTNKKVEFLIDLWKNKLNLNLEKRKANLMVNIIDAFIQNLFSGKVRKHHITTEMREIKNYNSAETANAINNKLNNISNNTRIGTQRSTSLKNQTLSISRDYTKSFFNNLGVSLKNIEVALINHTVLVEVQSEKFNKQNNNISNNTRIGTQGLTSSEDVEISSHETFSSYSKGYYINREFIKFWQNLDLSEEVIDSKVTLIYDLIKDAIDKEHVIYSFNRDENFELDFASGRKLKVKTIQLDSENCNQLEIGDLVFNQIDADIFDIKKIKTRLINKKSRLSTDVIKGKRSFEKSKNLDLQIDSLLNMFDFIVKHGYWIDLYRVGKNGRLYAQGITFQNISKELREIIFPTKKFENRDQNAAHPTIIYDLSEDCPEKEILGDYLSNKEEYHQAIKEECGLGKKAIKKRRSYATQGFVFEDDVMKKSEIGYSLLLAIKTLYLKLDPRQIVREEMKRTFGLIGDSKMIVWLHDGAIVRK